MGQQNQMDKPAGAQFTPETLHAMTDQERTQLFDQIITERYGQTRSVDQAAHDLGVSRQTAFRWRRDHSVPIMALLLLQEWERARVEVAGALGDAAIVGEFKVLLGQQAEMSRQMVEMSRTFERIITLLTDVPRES